MKPSLLLLIAFVCIYAISGKNVVQANSFSELWKKHGGEVLGTDSETLKSDEQKPEKKSKFSLPKIDSSTSKLLEKNLVSEGMQQIQSKSNQYFLMKI